MTGISKPTSVSTKQRRIAELARQMPDRGLHSLSHHIDMEWMREAHRLTRQDGASGVDRVSAKEFESNLEQNLRVLLDSAKLGTYRAPPVRRVNIPKENGKSRPIGIPTFGDKVLQRAVLMLLEPIYEQSFKDFSYGFRPGRSAHDALGDLETTIHEMRGGTVLEVDITSFFDSLDRDHLREIIRQRVTDGVVLRLLGKWLNAGVLEDGVLTRPTKGTVQGGVISPLLANIYLHEVLDAWWMRDVLPRLRGRAHLIRYADDFVIIFEREDDARKVYSTLPKRMGKYGLDLHPEKTRLVAFKRPAHKGVGDARPGTFDFLGFTIYWGRSRRGWWVPMLKTAKTRFTRSVKRVREWARKALHWPVEHQARILAAKLRGHYQYFGVMFNGRSLWRFYAQVCRTWHRWLQRRSQRSQIRWEHFNHLLKRHAVPRPRVTVRLRKPSANPSY